MVQKDVSEMTDREVAEELADFIRKADKEGTEIAEETLEQDGFQPVNSRLLDRLSGGGDEKYMEEVLTEVRERRRERRSNNEDITDLVDPVKEALEEN